MDDVVPIVRGPSGLTGRPQIARPQEELVEPEDDGDGNPVWPAARSMGQALPSQCLYVLNSPRATCPGSTCKGAQRDGGCLCDVVKAAREAGVRWEFEVDPHDLYWDYAGEPIPGLVTERRDYGQVWTRWEDGHGPQAVSSSPVEPPSFTCPHCEAHVEQDLSNFHWWCSGCGRNAKDVS